MAAMIKFPLKIKEGTQVKTIEELREHFDFEAFEAILGHYYNGQLCKWLKAWYYDDEAEKVEHLDSHSGDFKKKLCDILGVSYLESEFDKLNLDDITKSNERFEHLKQFTANDGILASVERVAFTQEELEKLLEKGCKDIYLCGERFTISGSIGGIKYTGINEPEVKFAGEIAEMGIDFQNLTVNIDEYLNDGIDYEAFYNFFDKNRALGIKLLYIAAEKGAMTAQAVLGACYVKGFGVEKNDEEAVKWYKKAAEQGHAKGQFVIGKAYDKGKDYKEAVKWYRKAAEQDFADAQNYLGIKYQRGEGVELSNEEANNWYLRAASLGNKWAQYNLGCNYRDGKGIGQDEEKAIEWFRKSAIQGFRKAELALVKITPKLYKLSEVILCAIDDRTEELLEATLDKEAGRIDILVKNRNNVNEDIIKKYGAISVWIEPRYDIKYFSCDEPDLTVKDVAAGALGLAFGGPIIGAVAVARSMASNKVEKKPVIKQPLDEGWIHIKLEKISSDMEEDFNSNLKSLCSGVLKSKEDETKMVKKKFWK